jgi:uncharacterized protein YqhQ
MAAIQDTAGKVADTAYSASAEFGRIMALFSAIVLSIIGTMVIIFGFMVLSSKRTSSKDEEKNKNISTATYVGLAMLFGGFLLILVPWLWYYFTIVSKTAAAVTGVSDGVDIVKGVF